METMSHHDYVIGLPDDWVDVSTVILVGPAQEDFSPNITVTREYLDSPVTAAAYAGAKRTELEEELGASGYTVVNEGAMAVGDLQCYQRTHTFMSDEGVQVQQMQVYAVQDTRAVIITCTDLADRFKSSHPLFMDAVRVFQMRPESD